MGLIMDQFVCHCRTVEVDLINYKYCILNNGMFRSLGFILSLSFMVISSRGEGGLPLSSGSSQLFNAVFLRVTLKK